jgi:isopentenyldiphosphate isomerase
MKIPIVDEQDNILYYKDASERDKRKEVTRTTALWLTDQFGNILLAQRAFSKKVHPGLWGPAVAGSVEEGETYESNIIKEIKEEIGLVDAKLTLGPKIRRSGTHEYFGQWFTVVVPHDYPFKKQDEEVEEIKWFSVDELKQSLKEKPEIFLPSLEQYLNLFSPNAN